MFNHMISEVYATGFEVSETILLSMKKNAYGVSLTLLLSFCEGSQTLAEMVCVVFPLYLWDTPWRFIPITCTDSPFFDGISLGNPWVSYSFNCCYFGSSSVWYFYLFSAFYRFLSWKTSIGGICFLLFIYF